MMQIAEGDKIPFNNFKDKMVNILLEHKMARDDENKIKRAFQVFYQ
jgi:hypothetical protein